MNESLSLMRSLAAPTNALEQGLNLHLLLGPYLDGAPACIAEIGDQTSLSKLSSMKSLLF